MLDIMDMNTAGSGDKFDAFSDLIIETMQRPKPVWNAVEDEDEDADSRVDEDREAAAAIA